VGDLLADETYPITVLLSSRFGDDGQVIKLDLEDDHVVIALDPLTQNDITQLVTQLLGGPVHTDVTTDIYQQSRGNPFYARLLVQHLQEREQVSRDDDSVWQFNSNYDRNDLPMELQAHLVSQIDRLGPRLKLVVQTAAVLGNAFDVPVLTLMVDDSALPDLLTEGEAIGLWTPVDSDRYEFAHSLLRSVAYGMLGQERQGVLHQAAGTAITMAFPNDPGNMTEVVAHIRLAARLQAGS
jgi:adenylate cyclase